MNRKCILHSFVIFLLILEPDTTKTLYSVSIMKLSLVDRSSFFDLKIRVIFKPNKIILKCTIVYSIKELSLLGILPIEGA